MTDQPAALALALEPGAIGIARDARHRHGLRRLRRIQVRCTPPGPVPDSQLAPPPLPRRHVPCLAGGRSMQPRLACAGAWPVTGSGRLAVLLMPAWRVPAEACRVGLVR